MLRYYKAKVNLPWDSRLVLLLHITFVSQFCIDSYSFYLPLLEQTLNSSFGLCGTIQLISVAKGIVLDWKSIVSCWMLDGIAWEDGVGVSERLQMMIVLSIMRENSEGGLLLLL